MPKPKMREKCDSDDKKKGKKPYNDNDSDDKKKHGKRK